MNKEMEVGMTTCAISRDVVMYNPTFQVVFQFVLMPH